jgi:hypothetical protein
VFGIYEALGFGTPNFADDHPCGDLTRLQANVLTNYSVEKKLIEKAGYGFEDLESTRFSMHNEHE